MTGQPPAAAVWTHASQHHSQHQPATYLAMLKASHPITFILQSAVVDLQHKADQQNTTPRICSGTASGTVMHGNWSAAIA